MKTITITIADPQEVKAAVVAEFGDHLPGVCLTDELKWRLGVWDSRSKSMILGEGETPQEAFDEIRKAIASASPAAKLQEQAAALGLKLAPADQ